MSKKSSKTSLEKEKHINKQITCKNCETQFHGKFCPNCGQSIHEYEKPFSFLIIDLAGNIFAFDTRFWKSLVSVIFKPGQFASEYLSGHRARYMPPFRFYIFVSFIFFVLLSIVVNRNVQIDEKNYQMLNTAFNEYEAEYKTDSSSQSDSDTIYVEGSASGKFIIEDFDENSENVIKALRSISNNPSLYLNRFLKFFSWSLFFMMPVYAFLLWMFYHKSRMYYYSHLILAINQHAFVFLIFIVLIVIKLLFPNRMIHPENYLLCLLPIYVFFGMMTLYKNRWYKTLLKMLASVFLYGLSLSIAIGFVFIIWVKSEFKF